MPFKSEAQHRKFRAMLEDGEISQKTFDEMMRETKKKHGKKNPIKSLPEKVDNEKNSSAKLTDDFKLVFAQYMNQNLDGGLADDKEPSDFNKKQLRKGTKVELEHSDDRAKAKEIAMDHLEEHPDYYKALEKMENKLEKKSSLGLDKLAKKKKKKERQRERIKETGGMALLGLEKRNDEVKP